jgi:alanyl-tRNA synthetase
MQKHKNKFSDLSLTGLTLADSQNCFRTVDLMEVGDGTHSLSFQMLGLFSFRSWTLLQGMEFWLTFVRSVGIEPDKITVHPDMQESHTALWRSLGVAHLVVSDPDCKWSDGAIGGYCTEMYLNGLEIGNIVNPLGTCLDCGFGLERLGLALDIHRLPDGETLLIESGKLLIQQGVYPTASRRGYVLRKIMRRLITLDSQWNDPLFIKEIERGIKLKQRYLKLRDKHKDKDSVWWWETHGIDLLDVVWKIGVVPPLFSL